MRIKIDYIAKIEGQAGFVGNILKGNVLEAKIKILEGLRLIEGILVGQRFSEIPLITSRICGICPVVHNLCAIKAIETVLGIKPSIQTILLRKLLLVGQIIQSHALHLFFLSLPDFFDLESDLKLFKKYPKETKAALKIRDFGNRMIKVIAGRTIHPISSEIGGFKKLPDQKDLEDLLKKAQELENEVLILIDLFKSLPYPEFLRRTNFFSLNKKNEYAIYDGDIKKFYAANHYLKTELVKAEKFIHHLEEIEEPYEIVKRVKYQKETFLVGALARVNNNFKNLNKKTKTIANDFFREKPDYNIFHNIFAQTIEIFHLFEEVQKIIPQILNFGLKEEKIGYKIKEGFGVGVCEAPRGTLYHAYQIDKNGLIRQANIITPTAQFLANLEEDLKFYLPNLRELPKKERIKKIRSLIRAYDPCITCATH